MNSAMPIGAAPNPARGIGRTLLLVFVVALAARTGWGTFRMLRSADSSVLEFPDEEQYWMMAESLAKGDGLRDELGFRATRMPLYPAFLAMFAGMHNALACARAAQWLIGAFAAMCVAGMAATLGGRRIGLVAGLITACDPFLVFFSSLLLTETLFITALCALWWLLTRVLQERESPSILMGLPIALLAAVCVYLRESSLGLVLAGLILVALSRRFDRRVLTGTAVVVALLIASLIPWAARNHRITGDWCWLTHRGGISLYDGVGPQATGQSDLGNVKQSAAVRGLSEVEWDRHFRREAIACIKADPGRVLRLAGVKLARMWNPFPNVESYRSRTAMFVSALWTVPLFLLALVGLVRWPMAHPQRGLATLAFLLLPAVYLSILHSLFIGSIRYRLPAIPMIVVLAAATLCKLLSHSGDSTAPTEEP